MKRRGPVALLHLRRVRNRMAESLFLVPAVMVVAAAAVGGVIDGFSIGVPAREVPLGFSIDPGASKTLLQAIATATVTTVGVVFSIVVVSVQLASGQFSPRILRNFFKDWRSKLTVGVLSATFTYSVIALFGIHNSVQTRKVPLIALGVAVVLALWSIMAIVGFLNHSARRLYVGNLAERVMNDTLRLLDVMERRARTELDAGDEQPMAGRGALENRRGMTRSSDGDAPPDALLVQAGANGWVQQVSLDSVVLSVTPGSSIRLETRAGAFVTAGTVVARVWPISGDEETVCSAIRKGFAVGEERTMQEDADYGLRQLSDIALLALSPSLNDLHTAIEIILRHGVVLERILTMTLPPRCYVKRGVTIERTQDLRFPDYVAHAFDDLRRSAVPHPSATAAIIRTCQNLCRIADMTGHFDAIEPLNRQIHLSLAGSERAGLVEADLDDLRRLAASPLS